MTPLTSTARTAFLLLLLLLPAHIRAQAADPAELLPAGTLAYLEFRRPGDVMAEIRTLLRNSYLEDPLRFVGLWHKAGIKPEEVLAFFTALSPEVLGEIGDWQGAAVALTGFTPRRDPVLAGVFLPGKSRMATLGIRTLLSMTEVRPVVRVEGADVYLIGPPREAVQDELAALRRPAAAFARAVVGGPGAVRTDPWVRRHVLALAAAPEAPEEKPEYGFFCALTAGAVVFGTTPEAVENLLHRLHGKSAAAALAGVPAFRQAAPHRKPGLFAWCDPAGLERWMEVALAEDLRQRRAHVRRQNLEARQAEATEKGKAAKAQRLPQELRDAELEHRRDWREWALVRELLRPAALRSVSGWWSLHEGAMRCGGDARLRPGQACRLLDLLPDRPLGEGLLGAVPADTFFVAALPLADGRDRWRKVLALADAWHAAGSEAGPPPSMALEQLEAKMKVRLGKDVLGRLRGLALACRMADAEGIPDSVQWLLVLEAVDPASAGDLETLLPALLALGDKPPRPVPLKVGGRTVQSLNGQQEATPGGLPAYWVRRGPALVLGWDGRAVAAALEQRSAWADLRDHPRALGALAGDGPLCGGVLFSGRQWLAALAHGLAHKPNQTDQDLRRLAFLRELSAPMAVMPPTLATLKRLPDGLCLEARQTDLRVAAGTFIDILCAWLIDEARR
jgi:hypothetical protein